METHLLLCQAIQERKIVQFRYKEKTRLVEPYMVAVNAAGHDVLSGWRLGGFSQSHNQKTGWREYFLSEMTDLVLLEAEFLDVRPSYNPRPGVTFPEIHCQVQTEIP